MSVYSVAAPGGSLLSSAWNYSVDCLWDSRRASKHCSVTQVWDGCFTFLNVPVTSFKFVFVLFSLLKDYCTRASARSFVCYVLQLPILIGSERFKARAIILLTVQRLDSLMNLSHWTQYCKLPLMLAQLLCCAFTFYLVYLVYLTNQPNV